MRLGHCPRGLRPVTGFALERYLGRWYEVARLNHWFEQGLEEVTAEYSLREDGQVRVINRGYDPRSGRWKTIEGRAKFAGNPHVGALKVAFFGPFFADYNIIALDEHYQFALVTGPSRRYLWILSREPELAPDILRELKDRATAQGFAVNELIDVRQS